MNTHVKVVAALMLLCAAAALAVDARYGQVSVGTSSASLIGSATGRRSICWSNTDATNPVYCDKVDTVTSSTGMPLKAGQGLCTTDPSAALPLYCRATGGTVVVGFKENAE